VSTCAPMRRRNDYGRVAQFIAITPAVNDLVNGSIHHGSLRKGYTLPAIRMNVVTSSFIITTDSTAALEYRTIQFDCLAVDYLDALRLKDAVKSVLHGLFRRAG